MAVVNYEQTNDTEASTTYSLGLPGALVAGNVLLAFCFSKGAASDVTFDVTGWTVVGSLTAANGRTYVFKKAVAGDEGATAAFTSSASLANGLSATVFQISDVTFANTAFSGVSNGYGDSNQPPSLTDSWPESDNLWFAAAVSDNFAPSGTPAGYTTTPSLAGGNDGRLQVSYLQKVADTEQPGAYTYPAKAVIGAATVVIGPAAGPSLTITNEAAITPGSTLTATASNFAAAPTTISLSDGASPALTPTLTATASGDDYDLSALIADFKAQADTAGEGVAVQGLRTGTITATVE